MKRKKDFRSLFFVLSLIILIYGLNVFWIGFHNVDLCHNEISIQEQVNRKFDKLNVSPFIIKEKKVYGGGLWSLSDCYRIGLKGIIQGLYISMFGVFVLGLLYNLQQNTHKRN